MSETKKTEKEKDLEDEIEDELADLPDANSLSEPEIKSARRSKELTHQELISQLGSGDFADWKVHLYRQGPNTYKSYLVDTGARIDKMSLPMKWDEFEEWVEDRHGGGTYTIKFFDEKAIVRRQYTFDVPGEPKFSYDECPGYFDDKEKKEEREERSEKSELEKLEEKEQAIQIQKRIEKLTEEGGKEMQTVMLVLQPLLNQLSQRSERLQENFEKERRELERQREVDREKYERKLEELKKSLEDQKPKEDSSMKYIVEMMKNNQAQMQTYMQQSMESNNKIMEMEREQNRQNLEMTKAIIEANTKDNRPLEVARMVSDAQQREGDRVMDMANMIITMNADEDSDTMKIWNAISNIISQTRGAFDNLISASQSQADNSPHLPESAPMAGSQKQKTEKEPKEQNDGITREEATEKLLEAYRRMEGAQKKISFLITTIRNELTMQRLPKPQRSNFCIMLLDDSTPEDVVNAVINIEDHQDLQEVFGALPSSPQDDAIMEAVFQNDTKCQWIDDCLDYIRDEVGVYEVEEEESEFDTTTGEFGDVEGEEEANAPTSKPRPKPKQPTETEEEPREDKKEEIEEEPEKEEEE